MQIAATPDCDTIAALDQMKRSVRIAFCGIMQSTRLPPMAALSLAATAVGLLYLEVAAAHRGDDPAHAVGSRGAWPISKRCRPRWRSPPKPHRPPISARFRSRATPER